MQDQKKWSLGVRNQTKHKCCPSILLLLINSTLIILIQTVPSSLNQKSKKKNLFKATIICHRNEKQQHDYIEIFLTSDFKPLFKFNSQWESWHSTLVLASDFESRGLGGSSLCIVSIKTYLSLWWLLYVCSSSYCKSFRRTNIKYYADPHQIVTNIKWYAAPISKLCLSAFTV